MGDKPVVVIEIGSIAKDEGNVDAFPRYLRSMTSRPLS
jgi:hypothetical protein